MQDRSQIYSEEEYRYELENRMKNLLWTVSGDYDLDVNLDLDSFRVWHVSGEKALYGCG